MKLLIPASLLLVPLLAWQAEAKPRQAQCRINGNGSAEYRGPCRFIPEEKGSFAIQPIGRRAFEDGIGSITVWLVSPGVAEVRGLTRDGINSRWGEARRSKRNRACWLGQDFSICVY